MIAGRVQAVRVGNPVRGTPGKRPCHRCGYEREVNRTQRKAPIYVCSDCKFTDPEYLRRMGLAS